MWQIALQPHSPSLRAYTYIYEYKYEYTYGYIYEYTCVYIHMYARARECARKTLIAFVCICVSVWERKNAVGMPLTWMSHVTPMNESRRTCEHVKSTGEPNVYVCVCVCVRERKWERENKREKSRERMLKSWSFSGKEPYNQRLFGGKRHAT